MTTDQTDAMDSRMELMCSFAGHLAHDLNNLLTPILAYGEMLKECMKPDDPNYICAREIAEAGERCLEFSRTLQVIGSARAGGHVVGAESLVSGGIASVTLPDDRKVTIVKEYQEEGGGPDLAIKVDLEQFGMLVAELVRNAVDAMPGGGDVTVGLATAEVLEGVPAAPSGGWVVLVVQDKGEGMTQDIMARMYEPFFTTRSGEGRKGLGLTLVYGIARRAGAVIRCQSEKGAGATFRVYFPRPTGK